MDDKTEYGPQQLPAKKINRQDVLLAQLYPNFAIRLRRVLEDMRVHFKPMKLSEGVRTLKRQEELYAQGRSKPGDVVTWALPGDSYHHYGCAADLCFLSVDPFAENNPWADYGKVSKGHGLVWGGSWVDTPDRPHAQITYGLTLKQIKQLYQSGGIERVWSYFDSIRGVEIGSEWRGKLPKIEG